VATEPYVPIAQLNTASTLLSELEVTTDDAETNATNLENATDNALTAKQELENRIALNFDLLFLVGA
jgi:hypothetical protein